MFILEERKPRLLLSHVCEDHQRLGVDTGDGVCSPSASPGRGEPGAGGLRSGSWAREIVPDLRVFPGVGSLRGERAGALRASLAGRESPGAAPELGRGRDQGESSVDCPPAFYPSSCLGTADGSSRPKREVPALSPAQSLREDRGWREASTTGAPRPLSSNWGAGDAGQGNPGFCALFSPTKGSQELILAHGASHPHSTCFLPEI